MKNPWQQQLLKELKQAGANDSELAKLLPIAANLKLLKTASGASPEPTQYRQNVLARAFKPALTLAAGTGVGMALVIFSQSASPTSWLYPVQKLSDRAAMAVDPEYRAVVMMRRAQQISQLVADHAEPDVVLATLNDYNSEAAAYKPMAHTHHAAYEYCKANLQQAAAAAPASVRPAILDSLNSLENS